MKAITAQKSILILALWVLLCQPLYAQKTKTHENFKLVDNFDKDKKSVKTETFGLPNISVDGGKGVAYHTEKNGYKVYALELSGETEKIQYVFYADAKSNLKIIKQTEYKYDKPTATDNLRKAITTFYSYENNYNILWSIGK